MTLEYKRYNSPFWREISKQVRIRDGNRCQGWKFGFTDKYGNPCNRKVWKSDSHIHHIIPLSQGGSTTLDNLILLCPICHSKIHGRYLNVRNRNNKRIDLYV